MQRLTEGHTFEVFDRAGAGTHLELFHQLGMSTMQALVAATGQAAACLGFSDRGVPSAGLRADLIAVPGNPLQYLDVLRAPTHVIIGGRIAHRLEQRAVS